jgi:hypothetical protein
VSLGAIEVKEFGRLHGDMVQAMRPRWWKRWIVFPFLPVSSARGQAASDSIRKQLEKTEGSALALYRRHTIYVSFRHGMYVIEDTVPLTVVHELAHALWERLGGELSCKIPRVDSVLRLFVEGFACYAEYYWFTDLYPASLRSAALFYAKGRRSSAGPHGEGLKIVERLVRENGVEILLRLPKNWRKYAAGHLREVAGRRHR